MNYYIGAIIFGILPIVFSLTVAMAIYQVKPIRQSIERWLTK